MNSIPVDSLGRTANSENKHSLWLQTYNCSLPNNSYKKTVVDAVGSWIFFLSFLFFFSNGGGGILKQNPQSTQKLKVFEQLQIA